MSCTFRETSRFSWHRTSVIVTLMVVTILLYWPILDHDFLIIDDHVYVTQNIHVQRGVTLDSVRWAFTTPHGEFWHPLVWLSLMLDSSLYGYGPAGYLFTNMLLHLLNTLVLFIILHRYTGSIWRSGMVALLFAVHPLHVESVAWISERKDVLSTFFGMLSLWAYAGYAKQQRLKSYGYVFLFFILGLMAKPMLVTLPFIMLLLDYWPLNRIQAPFKSELFKKQAARCFLEKTPLMVLAGVIAVATFLIQKSLGGVVSLQKMSMFERVVNALISYIIYIKQILWPIDLMVFYPLKQEPMVWQAGLAILVIAAISFWACISLKRYPFFLIGWLWYVIALLPVIGLVKIGNFAHADRYTYFPSIGFFIIVVWGLREIMMIHRVRLFFGGAGAVGLTVLLSMISNQQISHWQNSRTLFDHAIKTGVDNYYVHHGMGQVMANLNRTEDATFHFKKAVSLNESLATLKNDLGRFLIYQGKISEALEVLSTTVTKHPDFPDAHYHLGIALLWLGQEDEALKQFILAIKTNRRFIAGLKKRNATDSDFPMHDVTPSNLDTVPDPTTPIQKTLSDPASFLNGVVKLGNLYHTAGEYDKAFSLLGIERSMEWLQSAAASGYGAWPIFKAPSH